VSEIEKRFIMMLVDSRGRRYLTSWDACEDAARDFAGDSVSDFDIAALADTLFDRVHAADGVRFYERPEVSEAAISACDWTCWRAASRPMGGLVAERWERCGVRIYHVALFSGDRGPALVLTVVSEMGGSLWDFDAGRMYDSDNPAHWGWLDAVFGRREAWRRELAEAAARFIGERF
jgi:hypothetical protein